MIDNKRIDYRRRAVAMTITIHSHKLPAISCLIYEPPQLVPSLTSRPIAYRFFRELNVDLITKFDIGVAVR